MFESIEITSPELYEPAKGDYIVYVGNLEKDTYEKADYTLWFEFTDLADTPKDITDGKYEVITWGKHIVPLRRAVKAANGKKLLTRLVFMSNDHESDALGLALGISECSIFSGKFTQYIFEKFYIKGLDTKAFVECLGLMSTLVDRARPFLPTKAKTCTRYELLGNLTSREVVHLICDKHMGRGYNLVTEEVGVLDAPKPKKGWV
jgi:hypothetical protein